ncbi:MAG: GGDEF domain-containing protein [Betaproteobacteria bacterium]|nr:MAG: GGDEF domain-containing protein [Betaproteobacteria bacterium]
MSRSRVGMSLSANIWDDLFASSADISQTRLEAVLALSADAIITINEQGIIETFSGSAERIFGYSAAEVVGKSVNMLMPEPHASNHDGYINAYLRTGVKRVIGIGRETVALQRDGTQIPVALAVIESRIQGRRVFTGILRDLTHTKKVERELDEHRSQLEILVAARTAALVEANRKLQQLALTDPLTGVANRRKLDEVLELELLRAQRHQTQLAVMLCDVDHFKQYNDYYGHTAGDKCLRAVAEVISATFKRAGETCARYGGEEFAVVLPSVTDVQAAERAEMARQAVWDLDLEHRTSSISRRVTMSIGVAVKSVDRPETVQQIVERADEALYRAKKRGRNRIVLSAG